MGSISDMRNNDACESVTAAATHPRVGRKKRWKEDMQARFAEGTFARMKSALRDGESRTDFVRNAVEQELARREQEAKSKP